MEKGDCNRYLRETITKKYKKIYRRKVKSINCEAKKIAKKLSIDDRLEKMQENEVSITIKDYEEGFPYHVSCRLLNPSKTNIGKISKVLLDNINSDVLSSSKISQWKNASSVITWFEKFTHKHTSLFICFDVEISIHLSSVFYLNNELNLQHSSSRFLRMIHQLLCRPEKPFFFKVQHPGLKRMVMRIGLFQCRRNI